MNGNPSMRKVKYIIVGAGLSGLTTGHQLLKAGETDFIILESRDRIGGRILTKDGIDFGATWFQEHHQYVHQLCQELGIQRFPQFSSGKSILVYSSMAPAHYFENDPSATPASRIVGGTLALINALFASIKDKIVLQSTVSDVRLTKGQLEVDAQKVAYTASKLVVTIPPRIATRINFQLELPSQLISAMNNTHTWMSNAIKVGLTFAQPFWRAKHLSGMIIGQGGPVTELYDHSDYEDKRFALMGFVNEALREFPAKERKQRILDYLSKHLGDEVLDYESYEEKDWSRDQHTSTASIKSLYMSPQYGNPIFQATYLDGKLIFSGAETSPTYGGYMDGAIQSGFIASAKLLS